MSIERLTKESICLNTRPILLNPVKQPINKGKLIRGTNFHAYNKQNLGSIPSKEETVIVKLNDKVKAFNSCSDRFKGDSYNYNPGPGSYFVPEVASPILSGLALDNCSDLKSLNVKSNESNNIIINPSCNNKSLMVDASVNTAPFFDNLSNSTNDSVFITKQQANSVYHLKVPSHDSFIKHTFNYKLNPISSNLKEPPAYSSRFSDKTLYGKMYSPGPGQYKIDTSSFMNSKDIRYQRLFKMEEHHKKDKIINNSMVGPGYYHPEFYWDSTKYDLNPNIFSQSPERNLYKFNKEYNLDSGSYFENIMKLDESSFARTKIIKNRSPMFLDRSFETTFNIIKNTSQPLEIKKKKIAHYLASKELGRVYINKSHLPSVGDYSFPSSFKVLSEKKSLDLDTLTNKSAASNIKENSANKEKSADHTNLRNEYNLSKRFKLKQEERKLIQKSQLIEKDYHKCVSSNSSVFKSNLPKLPDFRNHKPGPAYYKYETSEFSIDNIRKKIKKDD